MKILGGAEDRPEYGPTPDYKYHCTVFGNKVYKKSDGPFASGEFKIIKIITNEKGEKEMAEIPENVRNFVENYMIKEGLIIGDEYKFYN